jgi:thioredoxin reductase (NADPH)
VIDVDRHPRLEEKWGDKVPVLLDGDREICHYYLDIEAVDARLSRMK